MFYRNRTQERAAVLIVVVGVLAVLSLLAATFGMVMIVETAASRNQTEYEMARQAAYAGYEHLLQELETFGTVQLGTGALPEICPDPANRFFCLELYRQKSLRVGSVLHESDPTHHAAAAAHWPLGLGNVNAGMFNINAMGHAADLGLTSYWGGNRYTTYEASLTRLLKSRFDDPLAVPGIDTYYTGPVFTADSGERRRVAQLIASAIINRRYGQDGLPGSRGTEEARHDHLPEWFRSTPQWVATAADRDNGAAPSGVFWGKVATVAGAGPYTITADNTGPGWIDWPTNRWDGPYDVYFATGANARQWVDITTTTQPNTLLLANTLTSAPGVGDEFCIVPTGSAVGSSDSAPTALPWPNGVLACENYISPLAITDGTLVADPTASQVEIDQAFGADLLKGAVIRIVDGPARGQVRQITGNTAGPPFSLLNITPGWTTIPQLDVLEGGTATGGTAAPLALQDSSKNWVPGEFIGKVIEFTDNTPGPPVTERLIITDNTENEILANFSATPDSGDTYWVLYRGYRVEYDYLYAGQVSSASGNQLDAGSPGWTNDQWRGCVVNIYSSGDPDAVGQTRLIINNTSDTLTLARDWNVDPPAASDFRIELPQDPKYRPDAPQGDDLLYRSVPEILPIMVDAIEHDPDYAFTSAEAGVIAAILYDSFKDYLTVSNRAVTKKNESAGINDWALDGIDNDENGVIDDEDPSPQELAKELYERLGLRDWAHASDTANRVPQAAQIVANIIDFRDSDHVPTQVTNTDLQDNAAGAFTRYGAEGLHVTEVMTTPNKVYSTTGDEIINDGGTGGLDDPTGPDPAGDDDDGDLDSLLGLHPDLDGWDWDSVNNCWRVVDPTDPANRIIGDWTFTSLQGHNLKDGWYAIRIRGRNGDTLDFYHDPPSAAPAFTVPVTTDRVEGVAPNEEYWGYVRNGARLAAVEVSGGQFTFGLTGDVAEEFYGFQLLPQYVEITNVAAQDIPLGGRKLDIARIDGVSIPAPSELELPADALIRGASADGTFPINYGFYVVAMGEEAYDRQWGAGAPADGTWDDSDEDYPVWFAGDRATGGTDAEADARADKLLLSGTAASVTLLDPDGSTVLAGGSIDGGIPAPTTECVSIEKESPLSRNWTDYEGSPTEDSLVGSQNRVDSTGSLYTCLNKMYGALWSSYPETPALGAPSLNSAATLSGNSETLPIILNRPYPSAGWLGLVPIGNISTYEWHTIDADPTPHDPPTTISPPASPRELLGTLISRALVGGAHARINLNNPSANLREETLKTVFDDSTATDLAINWRPSGGWANWDELLVNTNLQDLCDTAAQEDSGAGTYADDFEDDSDEEEEWARRYSSLLDLRTTNFKFIIAGLVFEATATDNANPVAQVRIEMDIDISGPTVRVVHFRYLTE